MTIHNNEIVEATESELFIYYLEDGLDEFISFPDYVQRCKESGAKIIKDMNED